MQPKDKLTVRYRDSEGKVSKGWKVERLDRSPSGFIYQLSLENPDGTITRVNASSAQVGWETTPEKQLEKLRAIYDLGPNKPMGYIDRHTVLTEMDTDETTIIKDLESRGLKVFKTDPTAGFSKDMGHLFAYDEKSLGDVLQKNSEALTKAGWPTSPKEYAARVATIQAPPELADVVADAYGERNSQAIGPLSESLVYTSDAAADINSSSKTTGKIEVRDKQRKIYAPFDETTASKEGLATRQPTTETIADAEKRLSNPELDTRINQIIDRHVPAGASVAEKVDAIRTNPELRVELGTFFEKEIGRRSAELPLEVAMDRNKRVVPGYAATEMSSSEYASNIALSKLDGSFNAVNNDDGIQIAKNGKVDFGQHRFTADKLLGFNDTPQFSSNPNFSIDEAHQKMPGAYDANSPAARVKNTSAEDITRLRENLDYNAESRKYFQGKLDEAKTAGIAPDEGVVRELGILDKSDEIFKTRLKDIANKAVDPAMRTAAEGLLENHYPYEPVADSTEPRGLGPGGEADRPLPKVQLAGPRVVIGEGELPTEIPKPAPTTTPGDIGSASYGIDDNSIAAKIARGEPLPKVNPSQRIAITEDVLSPPTPASGEVTQQWPEDWGQRNAKVIVRDPETGDSWSQPRDAPKASSLTGTNKVEAQNKARLAAEHDERIFKNAEIDRALGTLEKAKANPSAYGLTDERIAQRTDDLLNAKAKLSGSTNPFEVKVNTGLAARAEKIMEIDKTIGELRTSMQAPDSALTKSQARRRISALEDQKSHLKTNLIKPEDVNVAEIGLNESKPTTSLKERTAAARSKVQAKVEKVKDLTKNNTALSDTGVDKPPRIAGSAEPKEIKTVQGTSDNTARKPGTTIITDDSPGVDKPGRINLGTSQPGKPSRISVFGDGNEKTGSPAATQTKVGTLEKEWQDLAADKKFAQEKGLLQDEGFATELENRQKNLTTRTRAAGVNVQDGQPDFKNTSGVDSKTAQLKSEWSDLEADKKFAKANGLTGDQSFAEGMQQRQDNLVRRTRAAGVSVTDGQPDFGGSSSATSKGRLGSTVDTLKSKSASITTSLSDAGSRAKTTVTNLAPDRLKGGGVSAAGSAEAAAGEASGRLGVLNGVAKVGKVLKVGGDIGMAGYAGYEAGKTVYDTDKKAIHDLSHGNLNNLPKDIVAQVTLPGRAVGAVANAMVIEPGHKAITTEAAGGAYKTNVANQLVDMGDTHTPAKTLTALQRGLGPGWKEVDKKDGSSTFVRPLYDAKGKPAGTQTVEDVSFQMTQTGSGSPYQSPAKQKQVAADNKLTHKLFTPTTPGGMASVNSPASYLNPKNTIVNHAATTHQKTAAHTPSLAPPTTHQDQLGETNMKAAVGKTLSHPAEKTITIAVPHTVTTYKTVTDTRAVTPSSQHDDLMVKVRLGAGLQKAAQESTHVEKQTKTYYTYETKTVPSTYVPSAPPAPPPPLEGFSSRPANWKTHTASDLEDRQTGQTVIIDGKSHNGVTVNTFKDGTVTYQENGNTIGYGQPAGMKTTPTDTPNNLRQPAAGSSSKINFVSENGAGQATLKIDHTLKTPAAKTTAGVTNLKPTLASPGLSEHGLGQGNALPSAKSLPSAISSPTPEWNTTGVSSNLGGIGGTDIAAHGNALAVRDSRDGKSLITQMQDGTYQAVNKTTGAVSGAGTWGDGAGGGVAANGIRNPAAETSATTTARPSSTPSVAETIFPSATNGLAPKGTETVTTPATDNVFHPPSAATSAAKSNDMFSQAPAATPLPQATVAETIFPTQNTPATSVADRLVLPPVSANDVKVGGAFAGLDIGNRAHGFGRQMDN